MPITPLSWENYLPSRHFRADALSLILPVLTVEWPNSGWSRHWYSRWVFTTLLGPLANDHSLPVWISLSLEAIKYTSDRLCLWYRKYVLLKTLYKMLISLRWKSFLPTFETYYLTPCVQFRHVFWYRCTQWDKLVVLYWIQGVRHALVWLYAWHILTM